VHELRANLAALLVQVGAAYPNLDEEIA